MKIARRILAAVAALILTTLCACSPQETAPSSAASSAADAGTLEGTVYDLTDQTLIVSIEGMGLFAFPLNDAKLRADEGVEIGYGVTLTYRGTLNAAELWQDAKLLSITVTSRSAAAAETLPAAAGGGTDTRRARELLASMTLEEKVGQLFLARCPRQGAAEDAAKYHLGGYVLYTEDAAGQTKETLRQRLTDIQSAAAVPLLIAVDEEGGGVNRLSVYTAFRSAPFELPRNVYQRGGWSAVEADNAEKCALLLDLGINVNLAPVCDVCSDTSAYMYPRSFGGDAALTAEYAARCVYTYAVAGVGCVLKHFPGYGNNADTHVGFARDTRSLKELESADLLPFQSGIRAGAPAVLVSHNVVECMDGENPASLSPAVHRYLRETMGFDGVILTDDLYMDAVRLFAGDQAAVLALQAGNDLLCCPNYRELIPTVVAAVREGTISAAALDDAVWRVLCWKASLGLLS